MRSSTIAWVRIPTAWLIEFLRGMPVLLMMLFILLIASTGAFWAVVIALILYNGTLIGEILRAGLVALPRGQREAALSVGMREFQSKMLVEFPQAFRQMLPIIIAQLVVLLKDTSLGYIVGYNEIIRTNINNLGSYYGNRYLFSLFVVTLVDLPRDQPLAVVVRALAVAAHRERRQGPTPPRTGDRSDRNPAAILEVEAKADLAEAARRRGGTSPRADHRARGQRHPPSVDSSLVSDSPENASSEISPEAVDAAVQAALDAIGAASDYRRPQGRPRRAHRARGRRSRG